MTLRRLTTILVFALLTANATTSFAQRCSGGRIICPPVDPYPVDPIYPEEPTPFPEDPTPFPEEPFPGTDPYPQASYFLGVYTSFLDLSTDHLKRFKYRLMKNMPVNREMT